MECNLIKNSALTVTLTDVTINRSFACFSRNLKFRRQKQEPCAAGLQLWRRHCAAAAQRLLCSTVHRGAKCHFPVQEVLSAGMTCKTYSKALKYFIVYLSTWVFAVIEIYLSKLSLEYQSWTCFDVLLTQKYQIECFE